MKKILEKIFLTRGTYNYKLGRENAPLCHIVESTDLRFSPEELDKLLKEADGHVPGGVLVSTDSSLFTPDTASTTENVSCAEAKKSSSENSSAAAPRKRSLPAIKISRKYTPHEFNDDPDLKEFRIKRMLEHINVCKGEYEKWIGVDFALYSEGMFCSDWNSWSSTQPEYKPGECDKKWQHFGA